MFGRISLIETALVISVLLISLVIHEFAHAWTALKLGDPTAKLAGRLTLNPIRHLDPVGSVILPAAMILSGAGYFGYARPVPVNRFMLRGEDRGFALVALAGPASNVVLATLAVLAIRLVNPNRAGGLAQFLFVFIQVNLFLAAFNLVPIPPLDGSRLLRVVLPSGGVQFLDRIEPYGFVILLGLLFLLPNQFFKLVNAIQSLLVVLIPGFG
ncbi:MAG TPA: site-2 protease family protein [Actinomycetota bacterium]|nr:site-2 protease family protein [Actinomycetota bacterium]